MLPRYLSLQFIDILGILKDYLVVGPEVERSAMIHIALEYQSCKPPDTARQFHHHLLKHGGISGTVCSGGFCIVVGVFVGVTCFMAVVRYGKHVLSAGDAHELFWIVARVYIPLDILAPAHYEARSKARYDIRVAGSYNMVGNYKRVRKSRDVPFSRR